ncbi:DUF1133 family protein [Erwinia sorbitola]|uniref:DUF1133 family protein n=1 Tax=Erwinia sorbitola TaxID=2681984 RepID=A0ABW9R849_9GAMM|nr:DUF1133 family protein [Erwinia sorbitola]MTD26244.1 DUF1133 family protein [Erwinia sorbitola]
MIYPDTAWIPEGFIELKALERIWIQGRLKMWGRWASYSLNPKARSIIERMMRENTITKNSIKDALMQLKNAGLEKEQLFKFFQDIQNKQAISSLLFCTDFVTGTSSAAFQCGGLKLTGNNDGWVRINGEKVTSQMIKELGAKGDGANTVWSMNLMPAFDGNNYGFEFVKRNGTAFLNVQLLQASMDAPKIIGFFPCRKVAD